MDLRNPGETVKINVNKNDIKNGKRSCTSCPIALALKRKGFNDVSVSYGYIVIGPESIPTPSGVRGFMLEFDNWGRPDPIEFDLPLRS